MLTLSLSIHLSFNSIVIGFLVLVVFGIKTLPVVPPEKFLGGHVLVNDELETLDDLIVIGLLLQVGVKVLLEFMPWLTLSVDVYYVFFFPVGPPCFRLDPCLLSQFLLRNQPRMFQIISLIKNAIGVIQLRRLLRQVMLLLFGHQTDDVLQVDVGIVVAKCVSNAFVEALFRGDKLALFGT